MSAEELEENAEVDEVHVADVATSLPFADASVDLVVSRAVLEHVADVPAAARNIGRVVKPGGRTMHFLPGRYAPFAVAARVLPFGPLLRLLHAVLPWSRGQVEFDVHYDHCFPEALEQAFHEAGFSRVETDVCWASPGYFEWFVPAFLAHAVYEKALRTLGARRMASYVIVRATK